MPTFIRPARVVVDEGGPATALAAAGAAVGVAGVLAVALLTVALLTVAVVTAWWPVILGGTIAAVVVTVLAVRALRSRMVLVWDNQVAPPPWAAQTLPAATARPAAPYQIPAPKPAAIPGVVLAIEPPRSSGQPRQGNRNGE